MPDDPIDRLLDPSLAEALDFVLLLAYAQGWSDAIFDQPLSIADARLSARIEKAAVTWQARIASRWTPQVPPPVPTWLAKLQDDDTPRP